MSRKLSNIVPAATQMVSNLGHRAATGLDQVGHVEKTDLLLC